MPQMQFKFIIELLEFSLIEKYIDFVNFSTLVRAEPVIKNIFDAWESVFTKCDIQYYYQYTLFLNHTWLM